MLTVHHLEQSRSHRIIWLLEELGVDYEIKEYQRDKKSRLAPPELKAVHPLGKSPVITDGDLTVAETGNIIEYLIDQYADGKLRPAPDTSEYQDYRYWLHAGEGSVMPLFVMTLLFTAIEKPPVPWIIRPISKAISGQVKQAYINPTLQANLEQMEAHLAQNSWFAGEELSGADIQMSFPAQASLVRFAKNYPNIKRFVDAVEARPAYQRAVEKVGPLKFLA